MKLTRPAALVLVALTFTALLAAACSSSSDDGSSTTTTQAGTSTTAAPASGTQSIPVTVNTASNDDFYLTVDVAIGGGQPVPMLLDTGSAGLIVLSAAVGSSTASTGASFTQEYSSGTATTDVVEASVSIGGLSTPSPIAVGVIQASADTSGFIPQGVQGVLGIDSTLHTTSVSGVDLYSPLLQMGGSLAEGFTIGMPSASSALLVVGPVADASGATVLPLTQASPATYPTGSPAFEKYVELCWTVGSANSCQQTTLDTGSTSPVAPVSDAPHEGDQITPGTSVTIAAPSGGATLWQFEAASEGSMAVGYAEPSSSNPPGNSGVGFFVGKQIGFDYTNGRVVVTNT